MKGKCSLRKSKNGTYDLELSITGIKPRRLHGGRFWEMAAVDQMLPFAVDMDGVKLKPKLILRLFRKLKEADVIRIETKKIGIEVPRCELL